jgi:outer membrane protein TolC
VTCTSAVTFSPDLHLSGMRHSTAMAIALCLGLAGRARGQEPLTLDRAVQNALARNPTLAAAQADAGAADAAADEAHAAAYPRLTATESWQRSNDPVFVFGALLSARRFTAANFAVDALNHPPSTAAFRTTVAVDQIVFDGGRQHATAKASRGQADAAAFTVAARAADLTVAATETFGRVLAAQAAGRGAEAGFESAREDRARAARRRDAGVATDADVLMLDVHLADLERRRIQAGGDASIAIAELNRIMGEPIDKEWIVVDAAIAAVEDRALPDLHDLLAIIDATRPDVRRADALERAAAEAEVSAARLLVPQVGVQAGFDFAGTDFGHRTGAWIAGGALQWTFATGGAELARRRGAAQLAARARADAEDAHAAVRVELVTAYRRLETARLRLAAVRTAVAQARESQRIIRDRFDAGMAGVNDVLRASSDLLDAESNEVAARVDALVASAALTRAAGRAPRS